VRFHVVMSKCDLLPRVELAKRYTVLTRELSELQLRRWWRPLHMISSRTSAGVTELRDALSDVFPIPAVLSDTEQKAQRMGKPLQSALARRAASPIPSRRPRAWEAPPAGAGARGAGAGERPLVAARGLRAVGAAQEGQVAQQGLRQELQQGLQGHQPTRAAARDFGPATTS